MHAMAILAYLVTKKVTKANWHGQLPTKTMR